VNDRLEYLLSLELDGDLSPVEQAELDEALRANPELVALREEYARLEAGLDVLAVENKVDFDQLRAGISREVRKQSLVGRRTWNSGLRIAAVVAMLASVVGVLVMSDALDSQGPRPVVSGNQSVEQLQVASVRIELPDLPAASVQASAEVMVESPLDSASADAAMLHRLDPDASNFRVLISPGRREGRQQPRALR
jgi:predicted anti-sigma-YlaC factor YlaD